MKSLSNVAFYATLPFRLIAVGVACLVIVLAASLDKNLPESCDFKHAWKTVVG